MIRETEPPKPSTRITTLGAGATEIARRRGIDAQGLLRGLRGDLDWIVMRGLEKDRTRRYQSPMELAADLERHERCQPVLAGPPSWRYRLGRFVRRHRGAVAAAGLLVGALVAGLVGVSWFAVEAQAQAHRAEQRQAEFDQLAAVVRLDAARENAAQLAPPWPAQIPAMQRWLTRELAPLSAARPELEASVRALGERLEAGGGDAAEEFLHATLSQFLADLTRTEQELKPRVETDLAWAQGLESLTRDHPNARATWAEVAADCDGLAPQTGLVPIGRNPATGLWEFYDLRSAWDGSGDPGALPVPRHGDDGAIEPFEGMGLVLVRVPGGSFTMGSSATWSGASPQADPGAHADLDEIPAHTVALAPFLISRFEMTQGQWARLSGGEAPSLYAVGRSFEGMGEIGWTHPVENVSWYQCDALLRRHGMELPTEAQWEYACRARTTSPWWSGARVGDLAGVCNLLDEAAAELYPEWGEPEPLDDGLAGPGRIGLYRPNPFGLYDLHGNLMEWCRDEYGSYADPVRDGDGLRQVVDPDGTRVLRDGSHQLGAIHARSAARDRNSPEIRFPMLGVRPSRPLR